MWRRFGQAAGVFEPLKLKKPTQDTELSLL